MVIAPFYINWLIRSCDCEASELSLFFISQLSHVETSFLHASRGHLSTDPFQVRLITAARVQKHVGFDACWATGFRNMIRVCETFVTFVGIVILACWWSWCCYFSWWVWLLCLITSEWRELCHMVNSVEGSVSILDWSPIIIVPSRRHDLWWRSRVRWINSFMLLWSIPDWSKLSDLPCFDIKIIPLWNFLGMNVINTWKSCGCSE